MVKLKIGMNPVASQSLPVTPSPIRAIAAGFETVGNHIGLVLLPLALDVFLWLGPRLSIRQLIDPLLPWLLTSPPTPAGSGLPAVSGNEYNLIFTRFNLLSFLRIYPVGVPSLISGGGLGASPFPSGAAAAALPPDVTPYGPALIWQMPSALTVLLAIIGLWLIGLVLGVIFFSLTAQGALNGRVQVAPTLRSLPWLALHVTLLTIAWLGLMLALLAPFLCLMIVVLLTAGMVGAQLLGVVYISFVAWIMFPLLLSPLGIFARMQTAWSAVFNSIRITRYTLIQTGGFFLIALAITEGLDLLWRIPAGSTWLAGIGILGHAVISTALVAAAFIYYQDADRFVEKLTELTKSVQA
jgi:hypothetical protein